jgi:hypothetical protein
MAGPANFIAKSIAAAGTAMASGSTINNISRPTDTDIAAPKIQACTFGFWTKKPEMAMSPQPI